MQLFWFSLGFTQTLSLVSIIGFSPPFSADSALNAEESLLLIFKQPDNFGVEQCLQTPDLKVCIVPTPPSNCLKLAKRIAKICVRLAMVLVLQWNPQWGKFCLALGFVTKAVGYKSQEKNICNGSGQWILNSNRTCCYEMCIPRGGKNWSRSW